MNFYYSSYMSVIIKTLDEAKEYIVDREFDIFLERLKMERDHDKHPFNKSAELTLSDTYSRLNSIEDGFFDDSVMLLKAKTLFELLEKYPKGILINDRGGMCPLEFVDDNN